MADTTYIDYTQPAVNAEWLNEVNDHVWSDTPVGSNTTVHAAGKIKFTPVSTIAATNIQTAIEEILTDYSASSGSTLIGYTYPSSSITRTVSAKVKDTISVKDFGAIGNGITDDTTAVQNAFNTLVTAGGGTLYFPSGVYLLSNKITITCNAQQHISIIGDGRYQSVLDFWTGAALGLDFISTTTIANQKPVFEVHDIGLITSHENAGNALKFTFDSSANMDASIVVENVHIGQNYDRVADGSTGYGYWSQGINCNNCKNGKVINLHFVGELNKSPGTSTGISLNTDGTDFKISNSFILEATTGISIGGTTEGVYIHNVNVLYCVYGVRANTSGEPLVSITDSHLNCSTVNIWLTNSLQSMVSNCLLYAAVSLNTGTWPDWYGVRIDGSNSNANTVTGCTFALEAGRSGDTCVGISLAAGSTYLVDNNHFLGLVANVIDYAIRVESGVSNVIIGSGNDYQNVTVQNYFDAAATKCIKQPLVQSGNGSVASGTVVSFAKAFPNNCKDVVAIIFGTNPAVTCSVSAFTTTGFTLYHTLGATSVAFRYIATGD